MSNEASHILSILTGKVDTAAIRYAMSKTNVSRFNGLDEEDEEWAPTKSRNTNSKKKSETNAKAGQNKSKASGAKTAEIEAKPPSYIDSGCFDVSTARIERRGHCGLVRQELQFLSVKGASPCDVEINDVDATQDLTCDSKTLSREELLSLRGAPGSLFPPPTLKFLY